MSFTAEIDRVVRKLDQRLVCSEVAVEAVKQLIEMYRREPDVIRRAVDLHAYLTLQIARYKAQDIDRAQLMANLDVTRETSRLPA